MRIKHVHIENFRSIKHIDIDFTPTIMLIGPNNHGKTNIILAIAFFFGEYNIKPGDFFIKREKDSPITVEIAFGDLDDQDRTTFKSYVLPDDTFRIQRKALLQDDNVISELHGITCIPSFEWLWPENARMYTTREEFDKLIETHPEIRDMVPKIVPDHGRITIANIEDMQKAYTERNRGTLEFITRIEEQPFMGVKNVGSNLFGEFILIPAVRDISEELMATTKTALGKLFSHAIGDMLVSSGDIAQARKKFDEIVDGLPVFSKEDIEKPEPLQLLQEELSAELKDWESKVNISLSPPLFDDIFKGRPTVVVNDGVPTDLESKGHGLQRYFMFALIRIWTKHLIESMTEDDGKEGDIKARIKSKSLYFAIEEPELFLHPQAQRQMYNSLTTLAGIDHHQVIFCTHSSFFVDMEDYKSISIVTKRSIEEGTNVLQVKRELFEGEDRNSKRKKLNMAYWFNPDRSEMFFSKKVALVEGHSERALFPFIAQKMGIYNESICLVDCGGKGNIPLYQEVLNSFGINHIIIHDEDPIEVKKGEKKYVQQKRLFELNDTISAALDGDLGTIEILSPTLDNICDISSAAKGKALRLLENFEEEGVVIPPQIERVVNAIYSDIQ